MQLNWKGRSYRPAQAIKVYEPNINELMKPLSDKATKGTVFIVGNAINAKNQPQIIPTLTPTIVPTATPTPSPTATPTPSPTPSPTATPTPSPTITPTATPSPTPAFVPFEMTVKTDNPGTSTSTQFTIPTTSSGYDFDVDWGDSVVETYTGSPGNITHTYSSAGTYTVKISRTFPRIFFNGGGDRRKLLTIAKWGNVVWSSMDNAFNGCSNLQVTATDTPILTGVTSLSRMFYDCTALTGNTSFNSWNTSTITNMSDLFAGTSFNQPLSGWSTSAVTNMAGMFLITPFNQPINNWNVSNVTNFSFMFRQCPFNQELSGWTTSAATNMSYMFFNNSSFNKNINSWNTSNVTNMSFMFEAASSFNQPIGNWDVSNVTNMNSMLSTQSSFNQPLSGWNVSNVTNMRNLFANAYSFNQDLSTWVTSAVTTMEYTFGACSNFNQDINNWDTSNVTNMFAMFYRCFNFNQDLSSWDTSNVTDMRYLFWSATTLNKDLSWIDLDSVANGSNLLTFLSNTSLSTENYSRTLISFANQLNTLGTPINVSMNNGTLTYNATNYGGSPYSDGAAARAYLVSSGWTITDGGQV